MSGIGSFFSNLWTTIKTDEEKALLPALATAVNSVAANPTEINLIAQGNALLAAAIAAQPAIAQSLIGELAQNINAIAQSVATKK